jgi:phosphatidylserine/phosphatidylglycerophosphate/cardiolipin synthase-like enzyme
MTAAVERLVIAPAERRPAVLGVIAGARHQLDLSIFRCDDARVLAALADAAARGVRVRAIVTARARAAHDLDHLCDWLIVHGIEVRRPAAPMKYHAKYMVADDRVALIASLNYTAKCFARTGDFLLVSRDAAVVSGLSALFSADWLARPVSLTDAQRARLIIAPDDNPRARFGSLLSDAEQHVRLFDPKFTDPCMHRVFDCLRDAGVFVTLARPRSLRALRAHGKLLLIDDRTAVFGSLSLSPASLGRRRELAVVVRDPAMLTTLDLFWRSHCEPRRAPRRARAGAYVELVS